MPAITFSRGEEVTIGALSKRTGVKVETVRFYERAGILPKPPRTAGGHRLYGQDHVRLLSFVRRSRELGFSLENVRELLELVDGGRHTCDEVKAVTLEHLADVHLKIADLQRLGRTLARVAGKCKGGKVPDCPIIEALSERSGP
jgi:MerR family mercuric resistance operon transcriptional regulator